MRSLACRSTKSTRPKPRTGASRNYCCTEWDLSRLVPQVSTRVSRRRARVRAPRGRRRFCENGRMNARIRLAAILMMVARLAVAAVPTPQSHFGHEMGADRTVLDWDRVISYFQALEKNSDRIRVEELGKSTEG